VRKHLTFPRRRLVQVFTSSWRPDRSLDDCVESLGSERRIVTKVEVDVALERAIGAERGPAAAAHIVTLVGALPWLDDLADDNAALDAWEHTFAVVLDTTLEAADDSDPVVPLIWTWTGTAPR
jgi:hypothetical protein